MWQQLSCTQRWPQDWQMIQIWVYCTLNTIRSNYQVTLIIACHILCVWKNYHLVGIHECLLLYQYYRGSHLCYALFTVMIATYNFLGLSKCHNKTILFIKETFVTFISLLRRNHIMAFTWHFHMYGIVF